MYQIFRKVCRLTGANWLIQPARTRPILMTIVIQVFLW